MGKNFIVKLYSVLPVVLGAALMSPSFANEAQVGEFDAKTKNFLNHLHSPKQDGSYNRVSDVFANKAYREIMGAVENKAGAFRGGIKQALSYTRGLNIGVTLDVNQAYMAWRGFRNAVNNAPDGFLENPPTSFLVLRNYFEALAIDNEAVPSEELAKLSQR